jgi:hypothetical protein
MLIKEQSGRPGANMDTNVDLYDSDILEWSEHQAALLRRLAASERVNDQVDWNNVIEEVLSVGREQLYAVESLLVQALRHMLKANALPASRDVPGWRADAIDFRQQATRRFANSMRQRIDLAALYRQALRALPEAIDGETPLPVPETCPVSLDELLSDADCPLHR